MRTRINRVLNFALYVAFCLATGTGLILKFRLPPRSGRSGRSLMGLSRHEWGDVHLWLALALILLILAHLLLHRAWLVKIAAGDKTWRLWGGLAAGVALVVFLLLYPVAAAGG